MGCEGAATLQSGSTTEKFFSVSWTALWDQEIMHTGGSTSATEIHDA